MVLLLLLFLIRSFSSSSSPFAAAGTGTGGGGGAAAAAAVAGLANISFVGYVAASIRIRISQRSIPLVVPAHNSRLKTPMIGDRYAPAL